MLVPPETEANIAIFSSTASLQPCNAMCSVCIQSIVITHAGYVYIHYNYYPQLADLPMLHIIAVPTYIDVCSEGLNSSRAGVCTTSRF